MNPKHWRIVGYVVLGLLILWVAFTSLKGLGFVFDPFGRTHAQADAYASTDLARDLEGMGHAEAAQRLDTFHHQTITVQTEAARTVSELRSLPDANAPLDPERADRLRAHDLGLCEQSPRLCAAPDPAAAG